MVKSVISPHPITVEVTRGTLVEGRHRCHAVVADARGEVRHLWGDADLEIYPRSAIKPVQTLALIETGAADRWRLTDERIALAAASHAAAPAHIMAVEAWLDDLGLGADDLECGAHMPNDEDAARALIRRGEAPTRLHNNCSGKHTGFLATALHLKEATQGYIGIGHPVQKRLYDALTELGGAALTGTGRGVDGCGIPTYGMPLKALAVAMARLADPRGLGAARGEAARRIVQAMSKHNFMVSGRGRFDTVAMTAGNNVAKRSGAQVFVTKTGAEAVHAAILPGVGGSRGLGVALKVEDGAKRASDCMMANLLDFLGALDDGGRRDLAGFLEAPILNAAGAAVGAVRPAPGWNRVP